ncbi:glycoside hydrolase TIM-barrel-like domain-containing protein [uncultured Pedobacter sp.]|uniref:baseplate megatron protein TIM-barrel domain-containing protein n=1 Tax=uncultured Pedobacter sp. TaxID=246139 RepID=UPI0025DF9C4F|nr:glycoside hydrolase TIM-barrel-like domain-containing protein [uncultured Pedobacter sp.]
MAKITPITDGYINEIIKASGPFNPNLNKTQGIKLRELIKKLRDGAADETSIYNLISPAINAVMVTSFDEFGYDTTIRSNIGATKYFNAIYESLVIGSSSPEKTDFTYTVEENLSRLTEVDTCVMWLNWFSEGFINPTVVKAGISQDVKAEIADGVWTAGGYSKDTALQISNVIDLAGTQNDQSFINGARYLQERGYKVGFAPIVRFINNSDINNKERWRGEVIFSEESSVHAWIESYRTFVEYYLELSSDAGIDLSLIYIGSEMVTLSTNSNAAIRNKWFVTLKQLAASARHYFPASKITYAADWTEFGYTNNQFFMDWLWADPNIDHPGIDYYMPILEEHSDDVGTIKKGFIAGELMDYYYSGHTSEYRKYSVSNGKGKSALSKTKMSVQYGLKNIRSFINNQHYQTKREGFIADSSPLVIDSNYINSIQETNKLINGLTGNGLVDSVMKSGAKGGVGKALGLNKKWLRLNGAQFAKCDLSNMPGSPQIIDFSLNFLIEEIPGGYGRVFKCDLLDLFFDGNTLKLAINNSTYLDVITSVNINSAYHLTVKIENGSAMVKCGTFVNTSAVSQTGLGSTFFLGAGGETWDFVKCKIYQCRIAVKNATDWYGGTFHFEDEYLGRRTEWDANFILGQNKTLMATELGVASISGSLVEPNVFPHIRKSNQSDAILPQNNSNEYFRRLQYFSFYINEIFGPYGSSFDIDEVHQSLGLRLLIEFLKAAGCSTQVVYNLDARYHLSLKAVTGGALYYVDAPNHLFNHALNGKLVNHYINGIDQEIRP